MPANKGSSPRVYQLKVTLKRIRPPIWRRVQVPGAITLAALHEVLQTVFGWTDTHLHQFIVGERYYGQPDDFDEVVLDEGTGTLARTLGTRIKCFAYVYDFGDNWEHEILVERTAVGNSGSERPLCLAGRRQRPPEDCGGTMGYQQFLEIIANPAHKEHQVMLEWAGGQFDPEAFDVASVNRALARLSVG